MAFSKENYSEIAGRLVPWTIQLNDYVKSDYKLVTEEGSEFFILAEPKVEEALDLFEWWSVKLSGRLNRENSIFVPEKIVPTQNKRVYEN